MEPSSNSPEILETDYQEPVLRLTLNRPAVRNAFNAALISALTAAFLTIPAGTRVVILSGNGASFCAGGDLEWMRTAAGYNHAENVADALKLARLFEAVQNCAATVIVLAHGHAFGGGCGLVATADIVIAAPETKFAFSEVRLGLIPATIAPYVIRKIGASHARALFMTGEPFGSEHALRIGLVHEIAAPNDPDFGGLEGASAAKVKALLSSGPNAVLAARQLVLDDPLTSDETASRLALARASAEGREGVAAFLEKRAASFVRRVSI